MTRIRTGIALVVVALLVALLGSHLPAAALDREGLRRGLLASTKLIIVDAAGEPLGGCSGTILDEGLILTNFHCVGQTDLYGPNADFPDMRHGDFYHPQGWLAVAINENPRKLPVVKYVARYMTGNPDQDIAVLQIFRHLDQSEPLPRVLPIVPNILTDSDSVEIGDEVSVIGFPGLGGATVTFTEGSIAGFLDDDADGVADWFKTSALINAGNSGGTAVNARGEVIGIPSMSRSAGSNRPQDALYFIKPVNHAVPLVVKARQMASTGTGGTPPPGGRTTPPPGGIGSTPPPGGRTTPGGPEIGAITFGTGYDNRSGLIGAGSAFPSGIAEIHAAVPYASMTRGTPWGYVWLLDGQEAASNRSRWNDRATGELDLSLSGRRGLPDGEYTLQFFVNNALAQEATATVGQPAATPPPQAPPQRESSGVIVTGTILDYDTSRPLEGAVIYFLQPGVTVRQWANSKDPISLVQAAGVADESGAFVTAPPLPRGQSYSVVVFLKGYQPIAADAAFEVAADDPDVLELDPIGLERK